MTTMSPKKLGFFTRLLDETTAAERYRLATEQIVHAERCGFDSAWIAQHHFHEREGGLPPPLGLPVRGAEDAAVTDLISGGRLEVGVGPGGNLTAFTAFGLDANDRHKLMNGNLELMRTAWGGGAPPRGDKLCSARPTLVDRIWQATFSVEGARRAGLAGDGLMLSRTQPRSPDAPKALLSGLQNPMTDAYLEALPKGREPRILASRTIFVADDTKEAMRLAEIGATRMRHRLPPPRPPRLWGAGGGVLLA